MRNQKQHLNSPRKQTHRSLYEILYQMATSFMPASSRSGAYSALGSFSPHTSHFQYTGPGTSRGRHKHASEVR